MTTVALQHTPLDPNRLSASAQKALDGPMKLMAARGLAPLPDPGDLASVLYQLALDADKKVSESARKSAEELPEKVLQGALSDSRLDPSVLDYFFTFVKGQSQLVQLIILNPAVADETIVVIAAKLGEREIDLIAQNEQRLLRCPEIIGAMYSNLKARMSTVDRAVELAVRAGLKVPGIPAWEEVSSAVMGSRKAAEKAAEVSTEQIAEADAIFAAAAESAESEEPKEKAEIAIRDMTIPMKIRLATLGNKIQRSTLVRDSIKLVALAAIKAPGVSDMEAAKYAGNNSLCDDVIAYIANRREWTKLYGVRKSLVMNPKTPIPAAIRFLQTMRDKDLREIARSRGISSAVTAQAKKRLMQRGKS